MVKEIEAKIAELSPAPWGEVRFSGGVASWGDGDVSVAYHISSTLELDEMSDHQRDLVTSEYACYAIHVASILRGKNEGGS